MDKILITTPTEDDFVAERCFNVAIRDVENGTSYCIKNMVVLLDEEFSSPVFIKDIMDKLIYWKAEYDALHSEYISQSIEFSRLKDMTNQCEINPEQDGITLE